MMKRHLVTLMLAVALGAAALVPWNGTTQADRAVVERSTTVASAMTREAAPSLDATVNVYAQREAEARDLESFTGGRHEDDVVVVSFGCVLAVLLIVILI